MLPCILGHSCAAALGVARRLSNSRQHGKEGFVAVYFVRTATVGVYTA